MLGRVFLALLAVLPGAALAADVVDATGRTVEVPDRIERILPAGPPAAVLLEALAPDLMVGWPMPVPDAARALLAPAAAGLAAVPRLTGGGDAAATVQAAKPDLIVDYGNVSARYADLAVKIQRQTGVPTILLDGSLDEIPRVLRTMGTLLHREARGRTLADLAAVMLAFPPPGSHPRVVYARGADGSLLAAPGTEVTAVFTRLGWQVLAPDGQGAFRPASVDAVRDLDPDVLVFADPRMQETLAQSAAWRTVRAVRDGHAVVAPSLPFGWIEEPPSVNRLLGLAWLSGRDPVTLAALFGAVVYGRPPAVGDLESLPAAPLPAQP